MTGKEVKPRRSAGLKRLHVDPEILEQLDEIAGFFAVEWGLPVSRVHAIECLCELARMYYLDASDESVADPSAGDRPG